MHGSAVSRGINHFRQRKVVAAVYSPLLLLLLLAPFQTENGPTTATIAASPVSDREWPHYCYYCCCPNAASPTAASPTAAAAAATAAAAAAAAAAAS